MKTLLCTYTNYETLLQPKLCKQQNKWSVNRRSYKIANEKSFLVSEIHHNDRISIKIILYIRV